MPEVDPKKFDLHPSTRIEQSGKNRYAIVIDRKSRIVMKDGEKIMDRAAKIQKQVPGARIHLKTSAPVCSKTRLFLKEKGITIQPL